MLRAGSLLSKHHGRFRPVLPSVSSFRLVDHSSPTLKRGVVYPTVSGLSCSDFSNTSLWMLQRRHLSSTSDNNPSNNDTSASSVDETLNKLFSDSQQQISESAAGDAWFTTTANAAQQASDWVPVWYNLADQAIVAVQAFHELSGLELGWSIVSVTVFLRLALFPLMVKTQQTTSRMAHLQPELQLMKQRYEALGTPSRQEQLQFGKNLQSLFAKYKVKPTRAFVAPLVQLPVFMGMFFGLRKMPDLFPDELSVGGMFWFTDLTAQDPLYILPMTTTASFLLLIEMGKDQMMSNNPAQGQVMINVFRIMSIAMIPVCFNFESAMLVYWTTNNILTIGQTALLKSKPVRQYFDIWDPPKPVPGQEPESFQQAAEGLLKRLQGGHLTEKQKMQQHNQAVESKKSFERLRQKKKMGITGTRNR